MFSPCCQSVAYDDYITEDGWGRCLECMEPVEYPIEPKKDDMITISLSTIKNIAKDIIDDDEWVNDSHSKSEYDGVKDGLHRLIKHIKKARY